MLKAMISALYLFESLGQSSGSSLASTKKMDRTC